MSGGYQTLTVAIAAELSNGKHSVGTGVPVARGLVLTARHIVCPDGAKDVPVRVRFWHAGEPEFQPDSARGYTGYVDALVDSDAIAQDARRGIVWSCALRDAALIGVPHPPSIGVAVLSEREPFDDAAWKSEGFPHAAWERGTPDPVRLSGKSHSRFPNMPRFQVDASIAMAFDDNQEGGEGWQGASGAALFVHGQVLGLLLLRNPNGEGKILQAVPAKDIVTDATFRAAAGLNEAHSLPYLDELQNIMAELPPGIRGQLAENMGLAKDADDLEIAKVFQSTSLEKGVSWLLALISRGQGRLIQEIALRIAACRCAPMNVDELRSQIFGNDDEASDVAAGTRMGAEFIMAAAEARLPEFEKRKLGSSALPSGRHALPVLPETGCTFEDKVHAPDLDARLGTDLLESEDWMNDALGKIYEFPADSPQRKESRRKMLQYELNDRASADGEPKPSYYFAEPDPGAERLAERKALRERIAQIREVYPQIGAVFIQTEEAHKDFARFRPLLGLLPQEGEA